jgi:Rne/Rng family ribonuclease
VAEALEASSALVVSVSPGETRVARLDDGLLTAVVHHRPWAAAPGAVLLGRVRARLPDGAAFVDLGPWGDGFLDAREMTGPAVSEGRAVLVQVRQAARTEPHGGTKAARLTRAVALTSPRLALGGRRPGAAVSGRVTDRAERDRLVAWAKAAAAKGESLVVRTGAAGADPADLHGDLAGLRAAWADLSTRIETATPPALVRPAPLDWGALVPPGDDTPPPVAVLDDARARRALAADLGLWMDEPPAILAHATDEDLFEATGVADGLDEALDPVVALPTGGRMVIEPTAALVAVDVDAGPGDARAANGLALAALPGELRLRGLSGSIMVDLIPGGPRLPAGDRTALEAALAADPWPARLAGVSRLGLIEIARERRGPTLAETVTGPEGRAVAALRDADRAARANPPPRVLTLTVDPAAAAVLRGPLDGAVREVQARQAVRLSIRDAGPSG